MVMDYVKAKCVMGLGKYLVSVIMTGSLVKSAYSLETKSGSLVGSDCSMETKY